MGMTESILERNTQFARALGLTANEAQPFARQLQPRTGVPGAKFDSRSNSQLNLIQRVSLVIWGYCAAVWLYVIAMQLRYPDSVYWPLALWLPIRLDYLGEAAFALSFAFALITTSLHVIK